jgi:hypothetical protein
MLHSDATLLSQSKSGVDVTICENIKSDLLSYR